MTSQHSATSRPERPHHRGCGSRARHCHAQAFVDAKERAGFALDSGDPPSAWFHIRCQGRAVMAVENTPAGLVVSVPAGVDLLAPDVLRLRNEFRIWLEHGERLRAEE